MLYFSLQNEKNIAEANIAAKFRISRLKSRQIDSLLCERTSRRFRLSLNCVSEIVC